MRPANPIHPGEMLLEEFLKPMKLSQRKFAQRLRWTTTRLNQLINGKRSVTPESAIDLGNALRTSPEVWLHLQMHYDLHQAMNRRRKAS